MAHPRVPIVTAPIDALLHIRAGYRPARSDTGLMPLGGTLPRENQPGTSTNVVFRLQAGRYMLGDTDLQPVPDAADRFRGDDTADCFRGDPVPIVPVRQRLTEIPFLGGGRTVWSEDAPAQGITKLQMTKSGLGFSWMV